MPGRASNRRVIALVAALVCLGVFTFSLFALAQRIRAFNARPDRKAYAFIPVDARSFTFAGRPVSLSDRDDLGPIVELRFGESTVRLVAQPPLKIGPAALPGLARHNDWLRVFRFAERGAESSEEFRTQLDQGKDRLVVVVRRPRIAPDPRTNEVSPRDWVFDFSELFPDGTIKSHTLRYPKTRGDKTPAADELRPNTWEMDAAMTLMPGNPPDSLNFGRPTASFKDDALTAAGWTLPVTVASALGLVAALAVMLAPRRSASAV